MEKDWTWNVGVDYFDVNGSITYVFRFWDGLPKEVAHFQFFIDADDDNSTGYNGENGWEISGADYLIEDGKVFKYNPYTTDKWQWDYIGVYPDFEIEDIPGHIPMMTIAGKNANFSIPFTSAKTKTMMEVYDANWSGNYPTILDLQMETTPVKPNEPVTTEYKRIFDADGRVISEDRKEDGTWKHEVSYEYDAEGRVSKKVFNRSHNTYTYTYNEKGDLKTITIGHMGWGKTVKTFETTYDNQERKIEEKVTSKSYKNDKLISEKMETYRYFYIGESDQVEKITLDGKKYKTFKYDAQGREASMVFYRHYDDQTTLTRYTNHYNDQSQLIQKDIDNGADGSIEKVNRYRYEPQQ